MSDLLAAAAAALGAPESLIERSAQARAQETGSTVDEVLAAWAGGEVVEASPATSAPAPVETPPEPQAQAEPATDLAIETPATPTVTAAPATGQRPGKPPVLVGAADNPMNVFVVSVGLFFAILLVGLVGPSIQTDSPGARTTEIAHTAAGEAGQDIYSTQGCAGCHTQMVRPIAADVGLGPVTLNDSNQVLGSRRFGPDLSDIGARYDASAIEAIVTGSGGHPPASLSSSDLDNLVTYLVESSTSGAG